jgi:hypothetical protein
LDQALLLLQTRTPGSIGISANWTKSGLMFLFGSNRLSPARLIFNRNSFDSSAPGIAFGVMQRRGNRSLIIRFKASHSNEITAISSIDSPPTFEKPNRSGFCRL